MENMNNKNNYLTSIFNSFMIINVLVGFASIPFILTSITTFDPFSFYSYFFAFSFIFFVILLYIKIFKDIKKIKKEGLLNKEQGKFLIKYFAYLNPTLLLVINIIVNEIFHNFKDRSNGVLILMFLFNLVYIIISTIYFYYRLKKYNDNNKLYDKTFKVYSFFPIYDKNKIKELLENSSNIDNITLSYVRIYRSSYYLFLITISLFIISSSSFIYINNLINLGITISSIVIIFLIILTILSFVIALSFFIYLLHIGKKIKIINKKGLYYFIYFVLIGIIYSFIAPYSYLNLSRNSFIFTNEYSFIFYIVLTWFLFIIVYIFIYSIIFVRERRYLNEVLIACSKNQNK